MVAMLTHPSIVVENELQPRTTRQKFKTILLENRIVLRKFETDQLKFQKLFRVVFRRQGLNFERFITLAEDSFKFSVLQNFITFA